MGPGGLELSYLIYRLHRVLRDEARRNAFRPEPQSLMATMPTSSSTDRFSMHHHLALGTGSPRRSRMSLGQYSEGFTHHEILIGISYSTTSALPRGPPLKLNVWVSPHIHY
ncbi:hypothetical protein BD309DRAFT_371691 [Dichomitus squalens]|uniref:Uncharacterized protein n=1 Tax=Dichomitus squalens TaxID=114155 RepID=A0A4Q9P1E6_9APHY|nr:hypothetical protein BD309DRAFT_371691 [Dichomitus squalens]TBU59380.1 hypothetical protein BD310DRAFT_924993 [Dichomitus squalens]